jgi:flavin-dependent dehydrogenase
MAKSKNVTFNLPPELIDKYKVYVKSNFIPSVNAGVKEALEEYSKRIEKEMLKKEMQKAAKDPLFLDDLNESMKDFERIDTDTAKENSEW